MKSGLHGSSFGPIVIYSTGQYFSFVHNVYFHL